MLLIPGFLAGDWTMREMADWLNRIGYQAHPSGLEWNVDCPYRTGELLGVRVEALYRQHRQPLFIIGHSLGGLLARFLGATFPEYVKHVIALGSHRWFYASASARTLRLSHFARCPTSQ